MEQKFYRGDAKLSLHQQLEVIREVKHKKVITIVDEAHLLKRETLEEIRFMLNYHMDSINPMALILVGQNELWDKLNLQCYAAVRQRIDLKYELPAFDRSQTGAYVKAHLTYAEGAEEIFTDQALDEIQNYSVGAARSINKVCMYCLMNAAQTNKKLIDDHMVRRVVEAELP